MKTLQHTYASTIWNKEVLILMIGIKSVFRIVGFSMPAAIGSPELKGAWEDDIPVECHT